MDETTLILTLVGVITPVSVGGLGWTWRTARNNGALSQKVKDLVDMVNQERTDEVQSIKDVARNLEATESKVGGLDVRLAKVETNVEWLRNFFEKNGKNKS